MRGFNVRPGLIRLERPSSSFSMLWVLLAVACLLAGLLKSPALARYAEQRFHTSTTTSLEALARELEQCSQSARNMFALRLQTLDRAVVFGLQELTHQEVSQQQAAQAASLAASEQRIALLQQTVQDYAARVQKNPKKSKLNADDAAQASMSPRTIEPQLPTPFKSDYADHKLVLSAGDRVLFIGDSLMQGVAPHAAAALKKQLPGIFTLDLSKQSTGLAYPGFYDWPATAARAITQHRINTLVVFMGANDFYDMPVSGKKYVVGTPQWQTAYTQVVFSMIAFAQAQKVRVVWMEMPPMDKPILRERVPALNAAFLNAVTAQKARWVPSQDLLSDAGGAYKKFIPNAQGAAIQMRLDDGVHFTVAGQKRLAGRLLAQFSLPASSSVSATSFAAVKP